MRTVCKDVFKFDELSDTAKEKARDWWRQGESQDFDAEHVIDDAVTCAGIIGIEIDSKPVKLMGGGTRGQPVVYWSGFAHQGQGASFAGRYSYAKRAARNIRKHAPQDLELHRIAMELQKAQQRNSYKLEAISEHRGRGEHSGCMQVRVWRDGGFTDTQVADEIEETVTQALRDFADWIYTNLEKEYDYRMRAENVDECIRINEYEFDEDGSIT